MRKSIFLLLTAFMLSAVNVVAQTPDNGKNGSRQFKSAWNFAKKGKSGKKAHAAKSEKSANSLRNNGSAAKAPYHRGIPGAQVYPIDGGQLEYTANNQVLTKTFTVKNSSADELQIFALPSYDIQGSNAELPADFTEINYEPIALENDKYYGYDNGAIVVCDYDNNILKREYIGAFEEVVCLNGSLWVHLSYGDLVEYDGNLVATGNKIPFDDDVVAGTAYGDKVALFSSNEMRIYNADGTLAGKKGIIDLTGTFDNIFAMYYDAESDIFLALENVDYYYGYGCSTITGFSVDGDNLMPNFKISGNNGFPILLSGKLVLVFAFGSMDYSMLSLNSGMLKLMKAQSMMNLGAGEVGTYKVSFNSKYTKYAECNMRFYNITGADLANVYLDDVDDISREVYFAPALAPVWEYPASVDFGKTICGLESKATVCIKQKAEFGFARILDMDCYNGTSVSYNVTGYTRTLLGGDSLCIQLSYNPQEMGSVLNDTLCVVYTLAKDLSGILSKGEPEEPIQVLKISLKGECIGSPEWEFVDSAYVVKEPVSCNESVAGSFEIKNTSDVTLEYSVSEATNALFVVDNVNEWNNYGKYAANFIKDKRCDFQYDVYFTESEASFKEALAGKDVVVFPYNDGDFYPESEDIKALRNFVNDGGAVVYCYSPYGPWANEFIGYNNSTSTGWYFDLNCNALNKYTYNLPSNYYDFYCYGHAVTDCSLEADVTGDNYVFAGHSQYGKGSVAFLAPVVNEEFFGLLLMNYVTKYGSTKTLDAGKTATINYSFSNLPAGNSELHVTIASNRIGKPAGDYAVCAVVEGAPEAELQLASIDFGSAFVYESINVCDTLFSLGCRPFEVTYCDLQAHDAFYFADFDELDEKSLYYVKIQFHATEPGKYIDTLEIRTTAGDYKIALKGEAVSGPYFYCDNRDKNLGTLPYDTTVNVSFNIANEGYVPLHISAIPDLKVEFFTPSGAENVHCYLYDFIHGNSLFECYGSEADNGKPLTRLVSGTKISLDAQYVLNWANYYSYFAKGSYVKLSIGDSVLFNSPIEGYEGEFRFTLANDVLVEKMIITPGKSKDLSFPVTIDGFDYFNNYYEEFRFYTNDPLNSELEFNVWCNVDVPANLAASADNIDFGCVVVDSETSQSVWLYNTGAKDFYIYMSLKDDADNVFSVQSPSNDYYINSGDSVMLSVLFAPSEKKSYSAAVEVAFGDSVVVVNLSGKGGEPVAVLEKDEYDIAEPMGVGDEFTVNVEVKNEGDANLLLPAANCKIYVDFYGASYAYEDSWSIYDPDGNEVLSSQSGYSNGVHYYSSFVMGTGTYTIKMSDSFGDGWNGSDSYIELSTEYGEVLFHGELSSGSYEEESIPFAYVAIAPNSSIAYPLLITNSDVVKKGENTVVKTIPTNDPNNPELTVKVNFVTKTGGKLSASVDSISFPDILFYGLDQDYSFKTIELTNNSFDTIWVNVKYFKEDAFWIDSWTDGLANGYVAPGKTEKVMVIFAAYEPKDYFDTLKIETKSDTILIPVKGTGNTGSLLSVYANARDGYYTKGDTIKFEALYDVPVATTYVDGKSVKPYILFNTQNKAFFDGEHSKPANEFIKSFTYVVGSDENTEQLEYAADSIVWDTVKVANIAYESFIMNDMEDYVDNYLMPGATFDLKSGLLNSIKFSNKLADNSLIVIDNIAPVAVLSTPSNAVNVNVFNVTAKISEYVTGFGLECINVVNGVASNLVADADGVTYTFTVTASAEGDVKVSVLPGKAFDFVGLTLTSNELVVNYTKPQSDPGSVAEEGVVASISVYPNPAVETINVVVAGGNGKIELLNVDGKVIMVENISSDITTINVSNLTSGAYFFRVVTDNNVSVERWIKK